MEVKSGDEVMRKERLELSRISSLEPKSSASANSATFAKFLRHKLSWGERWVSNPRPPEPQPGALPTELRPPLRDLTCKNTNLNCKMQSSLFLVKTSLNFIFKN